MTTIRIALTGDREDDLAAHRAIPRALHLAAAAVGCNVETRWVPTTELASGSSARSLLAGFHGHWSVPGRLYASQDGALAGIAASREAGRPFLGTCAGFQYAVLECARNLAGVEDGAHEGMDPGAANAVVLRLEPPLVGQMQRVMFVPGSRLAEAYGRLSAVEGYHCSHGLNPAFRGVLERAGVAVSAVDEAGTVHGIELKEHPFFVATLFQPSLSALAGNRPHPLVAAFVEAARVRAAGSVESARPATV